MPGPPSLRTHADGHGDVFGANMGAMIVHIQRESGLAHRTFVLRSWQVHLARAVVHRWTRLALLAMLLSWGYLAFQAARVPILTNRIGRMEEDAVRLDTLQQTIRDLQIRYDQLQEMLSRPSSAPPATATPSPGRGGKRP